MKNFNEPKLELSKLDLEDVICTSNPSEPTEYDPNEGLDAPAP